MYIDGYNVLRKIPRFEKLLRSDGDAARRRFVEFVAAHDAVRKYAATYIVFDGHGEPISSGIRIRVIFANTRTADSWIKLKIEGEKNTRNTLVVSSDHEVQNNARACGASILRAEDFLNSRQDRESHDNEESYKEQNVSPDEIQFWLDEFSSPKKPE